MSGRAHPVMIFYNLRRVMFLLIIPALHSLLAVPHGGFRLWLRGVWLDALTLAVMLLCSVIMWRRCTYSCGESEITVCRGAIFSHCTTISRDKITAISHHTPFWLRGRDIAFLRADTFGGSFRHSDIQLWLKKTTADEIISFFEGATNDEATPPLTYTAGALSVMALALFSSSALTGLAFTSALLSHGAGLLGREFSDMLVHGFEEGTRYFALGVPPAVAGLAYLMLLGWLVGAVQGFLRYWRLGIVRRGNILQIKSLGPHPRHYTINAAQISFVDIRRTLWMQLAGMRALYISAAGYGKHKDDISCVIPTLRRGDFTSEYKRFFAEMPSAESEVKPSAFALMPYIIPPICAVLLLLTAVFAAKIFATRFEGVITLVLLMLLVPAAVMLAVKLISYHTAGIGRCGDCITLSYSRGFVLHTVVIPKRRLVKLEVTQNIFQRRSGQCHVILFTAAEGQQKHKCLGLPLGEVKALLEID